jgi:gamma-glutamyltranspeptidase
MEQQPNLLIDQLKTKGHDIKLAGTLAIVQGIQRVPGQPNQKNQWIAACDPRADGVPASS